MCRSALGSGSKLRKSWRWVYSPAFSTSICWIDVKLGKLHFGFCADAKYSLVTTQPIPAVNKSGSDYHVFRAKHPRGSGRTYGTPINLREEKNRLRECSIPEAFTCPYFVQNDAILDSTIEATAASIFQPLHSEDMAMSLLSAESKSHGTGTFDGGSRVRPSAGTKTWKMPSTASSLTRMVELSLKEYTAVNRPRHHRPWCTPPSTTSFLVPVAFPSQHLDQVFD
jgi:hypothetical protein